MSLTDKIAEQFAYLLNGQKIAEDNDAMLLSRTIQVADEATLSKTASFVPSRIGQQFDFDMHQDAETKDFWLIKQGKLIRTVPQIVKG
jgi:hypothetical protein